MQAHDGLYIDGAWRPAAAAEKIEDIDPATGDLVGTVPAGGEEDVSAAVRAARAALPGWAATPPAERAALLGRLHDVLKERHQEIAETVTAELGSPLGFSKMVHASVPVAVCGSYAKLAAEYPFEEQIGNSRVLHEPLGVVGAITPWNYPLHQIVAKAAPAFAAGCTMVLKPAEDTPLVAQLFAEAVHEAGFPAGVFNLVTGLGPVAGAALAAHEGVDLVSFTGSTAVGRRIGAAAGGSVKRVALELGGKSANVVLPGADLTQAVKKGVANVMANSGQTCSAWTRMLVHSGDYDEAVRIAAEAVGKYVPGDPKEETTRLGPVVNAKQHARVTGFIAKGVEEGAGVVAGGPEAPEGYEGGCYVRPTVFRDVTPEMTIAQEEIFGPVLSILTFRTPEEAVEKANNTPYGLSAGIWTEKGSRILWMAEKLRAGVVWANTFNRFDPASPFGGFKESGFGREGGLHGLEPYLQLEGRP
jgi:aldehyde dehydrogenase (NAD+)